VSEENLLFCHSSERWNPGGTIPRFPCHSEPFVEGEESLGDSLLDCHSEPMRSRARNLAGCGAVRGEPRSPQPNSPLRHFDGSGRRNLVGWCLDSFVAIAEHSDYGRGGAGSLSQKASGLRPLLQTWSLSCGRCRSSGGKVPIEMTSGLDWYRPKPLQSQ